MENKPTKLFIVDDHKIIRDGIKLFIGAHPEFKIVGESGHGHDALMKIEQIEPDIIILDISMPGLSGLEIIRNLRKSRPKILAIVLSMDNNIHTIKAALREGVRGYVVKESEMETLLLAIETALQGKIYLSPAITELVVHDYLHIDAIIDDSQKEHGIKNSLSNREREIAKLICEGQNNEAIAQLLHISPMTVKTHRHNILKKLNVHTTAEIIKFGYSSGLVP